METIYEFTVKEEATPRHGRRCKSSIYWNFEHNDEEAHNIMAMEIDDMRVFRGYLSASAYYYFAESIRLLLLFQCFL